MHSNHHGQNVTVLINARTKNALFILSLIFDIYYQTLQPHAFQILIAFCLHYLLSVRRDVDVSSLAPLKRFMFLTYLTLK